MNRNRRLPLLAIGASVWISLGTMAFGQFFGGPGGDFRRRMLERMDQNGNGVLEPNEVSGRAQGFVERMARDAGLDPGRPLSIDRIVGGSSEGRDRGGRGRDGGRDDRGRSSNDGDRDEYPLLARFGEPGVVGFGVNPLSLNGKVVDLQKRYDRRTLDYVDRMMSRYDKNGNGILEHGEWSGISWRDDPRESDLDKDGRLTKAEMAERIANRNSRDGDRRGDTSSRRSSVFTRGRDSGDRDRESRFGRGGFFGRGGGDEGDRGRGERDGEDRGRGSFFGRGGPDGGDRGQGGFGRGGFGRGGREDGDSGEGRDGGRRGGMRGGGFDPSAMLSRFDQDGDGTINPDEIDERFRRFSDRIFERAGLDPSKPVRIEEFTQRLRERTAEGGRGSDDRRRQREAQQEQERPRVAYRVDGAARFNGRKTYRQSGPALPTSLPQWWNQRDVDTNGQVTMSEFLDGRIDTKTIDQFLDIDFNDDGVITPKEAAAE